MSLYQRLFAEIGRAWDLGYEDEPAVLGIVSEVKGELQRVEENNQDKDRRDVLDELCDVTVQLLQQHRGSVLPTQSSIESFSISKRVPSKQSSLLSNRITV